LLTRLPPAVGGNLVQYIGLFKPRVQSLRWSRALALAQDVLALIDGLPDQVAAGALSDTVEAMRGKRSAPGWQPLSNHRYLTRVLESAIARGPVMAVTMPAAGAAPQSKTAQILALLDAYHDDAHPAWWVRAVCDGLRGLVLLSIDGQPAADLWGEVVRQWMVEMWPRREWREDCRFRGRARIAEAFRQAGAAARRWPAPRDVLEHVPRA
jgi:hypothetical protein